MAAPGWYPDPSGDKHRESFWDGTRWTSTRPSLQQNAQPGTAAGWYPNSQIPSPWPHGDGQRWTGRPVPAGPVEWAQDINPKFLLLAILAVLVVIAIALLSSKPWESQGYKHCVAEQKAQAGGTSNVNSQLEGGIKEYCHRNYD